MVFLHDLEFYLNRREIQTNSNVKYFNMITLNLNRSKSRLRLLQFHPHKKNLTFKVKVGSLSRHVLKLLH
jgi:hypothetical protein